MRKTQAVGPGLRRMWRFSVRSSKGVRVAPSRGTAPFTSGTQVRLSARFRQRLLPPGSVLS